MFVKFSLTIYGVNFTPDKIVNNLNTTLIVDEMVVDHMYMGKDIETNLLSFEHKNKFSKEYYDGEYEQEFVDFFRNNYALLKKYGAEEFVLMMDIFYCDQCNFEIFDKDKLPELAKGDVSLPISVYYLEPDNYYDDLYYKLNPDLEYGERL